MANSWRANPDPDPTPKIKRQLPNPTNIARIRRSSRAKRSKKNWESRTRDAHTPPMELLTAPQGGGHQELTCQMEKLKNVRL